MKCIRCGKIEPPFLKKPSEKWNAHHLIPRYMYGIDFDESKYKEKKYWVCPECHMSPKGIHKQVLDKIIPHWKARGMNYNQLKQFRERARKESIKFLGLK